MKKLLALVLVLGLASAASAALQISVHPMDGSTPPWDPFNPQDSEISIPVSGMLSLDVWTDTDIPMFNGGSWATIVADEAGSIAGGQALPIEGFDPSEYANKVNGPVPGAGVDPPAGVNGNWGTVFNLSSPLSPKTIPAGTVLVDAIDFHCEAPGDAVIELWMVEDQGGVGVLTDLVDSVVIHQVPEPFTLSLLSLGGLALLRRRG